MLQPTNQSYRLFGCALLRPFRRLPAVINFSHRRQFWFPSAFAPAPCTTNPWPSRQACINTLHHRAFRILVHCAIRRSHSLWQLSLITVTNFLLASISRHWRSSCYFRDGYGKKIAFEIHHIDYAGLTAVLHRIPCTIAAFGWGSWEYLDTVICTTAAVERFLSRISRASRKRRWKGRVWQTFPKDTLYHHIDYYFLSTALCCLFPTVFPCFLEQRMDPSAVC